MAQLYHEYTRERHELTLYLGQQLINNSKGSSMSWTGVVRQTDNETNMNKYNFIVCKDTLHYLGNIEIHAPNFEHHIDGHSGDPSATDQDISAGPKPTPPN